jgi:hypothetical protein
MRLAFLFPALFAMLLFSCSSRSRPVAKVADDIRHAIPAGWSVSISNATVRIRSERDITLIGRISRPAMPGGMEQLAREMGHTTKYEVMLSVVPLLSSVELERLRAARRPFEQVLDTGALSKMDFTKAQIGYEQHRVPTFYTDDYSVFVDRPVDRFVEIYPPDAAAQVERLMASLRGLFHEY